MFVFSLFPFIHVHMYIRVSLNKHLLVPIIAALSVFMGGAGVQRSMEELHVHVHCVIQELESAVRREENAG